MPETSTPETGKQGEKEWAMYYNGFTEEEIAGWFEETFGYPPDDIKFTGGGALAGPLRDTDANT